jgi:hypothetical protein
MRTLQSRTAVPQSIMAGETMRKDANIHQARKSIPEKLTRRRKKRTKGHSRKNSYEIERRWRARAAIVALFPAASILVLRALLQ